MDHMNYINTLKEDDFRQLTGVKRATFAKMVEILKQAYIEKHKRRGTKPKLTLDNQLLMALKYLRDYTTFKALGAYFRLHETTAIRTVHWVEDVLSKAKEFQLPGKKRLQESDMEFEVFVVDATEHQIERPKRSQKKESQE